MPKCAQLGCFQMGARLFSNGVDLFALKFYVDIVIHLFPIN